METITLTIQPLAETLIVLFSFLIIVGLLFLLIRKNYLKEKRDRVLAISDFPKLNELLKLLEFRIKDKKADIYFTLMLIGIDDIQTLSEIVGQKGCNYYLDRFVEALRNDLPVGAKISKTTEKGIYLIYLPELYLETQLEDVASMFKKGVEKKILYNNSIPIQKTVSIATTIYPNDGYEIDTLINNLILALYSIKKCGGNDILVYNSQLENSREIIEGYKKLVEAINDGHIKAVFNFLVKPDTKSLSGLEMSLQWLKSEGEIIDCNSIIKEAEKTDNDSFLISWAIEKLLALQSEVSKVKVEKEFCYIVKSNLNYINKPDTLPNLIALLDIYNLSPNQFMIEVVDFLEKEIDGKTAKSIQQIKSTGMRVIAKLKQIDKGVIKVLEDFGIDIVKIQAQDYFSTDKPISELIDVIDKKSKVILTKVEKTDKLKLAKDEVLYAQGAVFGKEVTREQVIEELSTINKKEQLI